MFIAHYDKSQDMEVTKKSTNRWVDKEELLHVQMHLKMCAALVTVAKTWKQPKCPWTEEWIKKMWYIYTMEYYSAMKKE